MALRRILIALAALLFLLPGAAQADPSFPPLTGRVVDAAHILAPEQAAALDAKLAGFEQSTKQQVVVATIPDLQGYDIADYGYQLGRAWGIGQKDVNNGVVLIVAPNDRKLRIEVGYGLEGVLTDALSGQIIRSVITPRFKAGDLAGGINAGVDEIMRIIQLPPDQQQKLAAEAAARPKVKAGDVIKAIFIVAAILFFILFPPFARPRVPAGAIAAAAASRRSWSGRRARPWARPCAAAVAMMAAGAVVAAVAGAAAVAAASPAAVAASAAAARAGAGRWQSVSR